MNSDNRTHITRSGLALSLVSLLFIISGATGLAYEVLWFRQFSEIWGGSSAAMAAVVASFLCGLGVGARIFGPIADRAHSPLLIYAICELAIGLLALVLPYELDLIRPFTSSLYPSFASSPFQFAVVRFTITFAVLGPPTILMGATLPLLVRQFSIAGTSLASSAAWLYFANSLGAAAGAWITGFYLLPSFGLELTNWMMASVNFVIALIAWSLIRELMPVTGTPRASVDEHQSEAIPTDVEPQRLLSRGLMLAALITGIAGVSLQMVWARQMSLIVGGTTYAFTAVLSIFILGLALGSLAFRLFVRKSTSLHTVAAVSVIGLILTSLLGWFAIPSLNEVVGSLNQMRSDRVFNAQMCFAISFLLEGLPTFFMGVLFPTLVALSGGSERSAGRVVGRLYAWNAGGSILAATTTAVVLFPTLGAFYTLLLMSGLYGVILIWINASRLMQPNVTASLSIAAMLSVLAIGAYLGRPDDEDIKRRNIGSYLYSESVYQNHGREAEILFFEEAPTCNVLVLEDRRGLKGLQGRGSVTLRVNGKVDGGNSSDVHTQLGSAYIPRILRPEAKDVLVVGFGTGSTAGASCLFEDTQVECCEIERAVVESSEFFHDINHKPELQPNYKTILTDGRNHIQSTDRRYDIIISEPSNPWIAGISKLYTTEFYESVKERLASDGLLAQWLQTYSIGSSEFSLIVNTIQQVFPHTALVHLGVADTILLASQEPIVLGREVIDRAQQLVDGNPVVRDELAFRFGASDVRALLMRHLVLDRDGLDRVVLEAGQSEVNTDENLRLEFDAPKQLFGVASEEEVSVHESILYAVDVNTITNLISLWGWSDEQLASLLYLRFKYFEEGQTAMAMAVSSIGLAYTDEVIFLADQLIFGPSPPLSDLRIGVQRVLEKSRAEAKRVASQLGLRGLMEQSAAAYEELVQAYPDSASMHASLSVVYLELGRTEEAKAALAKALELDPLGDETLLVERTREARTERVTNSTSVK